jgi:azurin
MNALRSRSTLFSSLLAACTSLLLTAASSQGQEPVQITLKTLTAQMKFELSEIVVSPGSKVSLTFENPDDMPHNVVFCDPGTDVVQLVTKMLEKPEAAMKNNFLPEDPKVWLKSRLLNPHEKQVLEFVAPAKPGNYPYVCSFPGHAATMQGVLRVLGEGPRLQDLKFALYLGSWKQLPDFSTLTPHRTGDVPDNLVQLNFDDYKNQYGLVFTGKIQVPADAEYTFFAASDDGCRIFIGEDRVLNDDGIHPAAIKEAKKKLKKGTYPVRIEYFQAAGQAELYVGWKSDKFDTTALSKWTPKNWKKGVEQKPNDFVGMPLQPTDAPIIYRNFVAGAGNRSISVGFPSGLNFAWSAETMNFSLAWRGAFVDAARHWKSRGGGHQPPAGFDVLRPAELAPPFAVLNSSDSPWPSFVPDQPLEGYAWKGYQLDTNGVPTFHYTWMGVAVEDRIDAKGDFKSGGTLVRTLTLNGDIPSKAFLLLSKNAKITTSEKGFAVAGEKLNLVGTNYSNQCLIQAEGAKAVGDALLVPVRKQIQVTYAWPDLHPANHAHVAQ